MPRFTPFSEFVDGDIAWNGIDMTRDRSLLKQGTLAYGQNTRTRSGRVTQRGGTIIPGDFNPTFAERIIGSGIYRNPNGAEVMLLAPAEQTYVIAVQYGKDSYKINYSAAEIARGGNNGVGRVTFVQAFDKVLLIRSPDIIGTPPMVFLVWNGTGDANNDGVADTNFEIISLSSTGVQLVPSTWDGEPVADRVVYYNSNYLGALGRDYWILSDIQDYTSFEAPYQIGRTNSGESDYITRIMAYFRGSFLVLKSQSIHQVTPIPGVFPIQFDMRILTNTIGSYGQYMPLMVGGDVIFLSDPGGFYRLVEVIQEQITTLPVAISEPIQPFIDSINWPITKLFGCSASVDNYAFFGVAIGIGASRCNAIAVYNTQTSLWESVADTWSDPSFGFNRLHVTEYNGNRRVFAVDYENARIYLLYEGIYDVMPKTSLSVPFKMETRGYVGDDPFAFKQFWRATVNVATVSPSINVTAIMDGVNEEKLLTPKPITKSRDKFYTHGKAKFNPQTDDPNQPYREDYEIIQPIPPSEDAAIEDFEELPVGTILQLPGTSTIALIQGPTIQKQQTSERRLIRDRGRWVSLRIENTLGICDVVGVSVEGTQTANTVRTAA
jgi:hypothetical protein